MLKRYQNTSLAVILALSSAKGLAQPSTHQGPPIATKNLNEEVKERRSADSQNPEKPYLRIYGREILLEQVYASLLNDRPVFLVGPERIGRTAVVEAMLIEQEFSMNEGLNQREFIVHSFEMDKALERYDRLESPRPSGLDNKLSLDETSLRSQQQAATASLNEALQQIESLNGNKEDNKTHVLKIRVNGLTPGFSEERASGGFFDLIKQAMQKQIPLIIETTPNVYASSFGRIHDFDQLAVKIEVGALPEDKIRVAVYDRIKEILHNQKNTAAKKVDFSQLAIEEIVRMVQIKGSGDVISVTDTMVKELILEKTMGEKLEAAKLKRQMDQVDHEIKITMDREALKKLNLAKLELIFKLKSFEIGKVDIKDLNNIKETLGKPTERGLVAGALDKAVSFLSFGRDKKNSPQQNLPDLTWDDVVPKDEIARNNFIKRVNDFVEYVQAVKDPSVSVAAIQNIAVKKLGVQASQLKFNPQNIKQNLRSYLDKRVIGMSELKSTLIGDLTRRLEEGPDKMKPNKPITNFSVAGPTGVGKSELLRSIADGTGMAVVRLNGNELMDAFAKTAITKSPPGYIGSDKKVAMEVIADNPNGKFLLWIDEIDKLPIQTLQTLMEAMDAGELKLTDGRTIHFNNTMIGSTSNWAPEIFSIKYGSEEWLKLLGDLNIKPSDLHGKNYQKIMQKVLIEYLVNVGHAKMDDHNRLARVKYPRELLARFSDFYVVQQLSAYESRRVIVKTLLELQQSYQNRGIRLMYSSDLVYQLRSTFDKDLNGRGIESAVRDIQREVKDVVDAYIEKNNLSKSAFNENYVVVVDAEVMKAKQFVDLSKGEPTLGLTRDGVSIDVKEKLVRQVGSSSVNIVERNIFEEISKQVMAEAEALKKDPHTGMFYRNKQSPGLAAPTSVEKVFTGGEQSTFLTERAIEKLRTRFRAR